MKKATLLSLLKHVLVIRLVMAYMGDDLLTVMYKNTWSSTNGTLLEHCKIFQTVIGNQGYLTFRLHLLMDNIKITFLKST